MSNLIENHQQLQSQLAKLTDFVGHFGSRFPYGVPLVTTTDATVYVNEYGEDKAKSTALAGELFGKTGWIKTPTYRNTGFDWKRTIMGVVIILSDAESVPDMQERPVDPKEFPILLEDQQDAREV